MNRAQRIKALEASLVAIDAAIARVESALPFAATSTDMKKLAAQLSALKSERFNIGVQLANLRAAESTLTPLDDSTAAHLKSLATDLDNAILDRSIVSATIDFAADVLGKAREVKEGLA